jgi:long-chain fatty acid transport protein
MQMKVLRAGRLWLLAGCAVLPAALGAQAFGLNEIGSCAVARGFATTASPCRDASTIYWNPAAATWLDGWNVSAGVASIAVNGSFRQDSTGRRFDSNAPTSWVPHAFINYHAPTSRFAWGLGLYVPYGLTSQWQPDFPGRFEAQKASIQTFYVQPNVAWQINSKWSIGGGPVYGHSSVELIQAVDLSTQLTPTGATFGQLGIASGTEFAQGRLKGTGSAWGVQVGLSGRPTPEWSVGVRFLSALDINYDGADATFTQVPTGLIVGGTLQAPLVAFTPIDSVVAPEFRSGGPLVSQSASTKIVHPAQIQAGLAPRGRLRMGGLEAVQQPSDHVRQPGAQQHVDRGIQ